jgi:hypothetical protein
MQCGEPVRGDPPDQSVIDVAVLVEHGDLVLGEPPELGVLVGLEPWSGQVAVDADQKIDLQPFDTIVANVGVVANDAQQVGYLPARLFPHLPAQRVLHALAGIEVPADNVPAVGKQAAVRGPALEEEPAVVIDDQSSGAA